MMNRGKEENIILNRLYRGMTTVGEFCWDNLTTVPILYLMTPGDIEYIKKLILSPRYSGNNKYKMEKIDEVMHFRGFTRFAGGTNRLVYTHPQAPNAVFKVAIDMVGINDNPAEFKNQKFLKPYCCKVFECSPCGTIASFEKLDRITTFEEFYSIADDYFYLLSRVILGKYIMEDIGADYFMNIGIRKDFGVALLDFPYLFELDGRKIECQNKLDNDSICHGEIDYDHGFNKLICKKCGRIYRARDLAKPPESSGILLRQEGGRRMKLSIMRGDKVVKSYDTTVERDYLSKNDNDVMNRGNNGVNIILERVPSNNNKSNKSTTKKEVKKDEVVTKAETFDKNNVNDNRRVIKTIDVSPKAPKEKKESDISGKISLVRSENEDKKMSSKKESTVTKEKAEIASEDKKDTTEAPIQDFVVSVSADKTEKFTKPNKKGSKKNKSIETPIKEKVNNKEKMEPKVIEEKPVNEMEEPKEVIKKQDQEEMIPAVMFGNNDESKVVEIEDSIDTGVEIQTIFEEFKPEEKSNSEIVDENIPLEESDTEENVDEVLEEVAIDTEQIETSGYGIKLVTELPEDEDSMDDIFYCLYNPDEVNPDDYDDLSRCEDIDQSKFEIYYKCNGELIRVAYNYDENIWVSYYDEFDDEEADYDDEKEFHDKYDEMALEVLQKTGGKMSLEELKLD